MIARVSAAVAAAFVTCWAMSRFAASVLQIVLQGSALLNLLKRANPTNKNSPLTNCSIPANN